MGGTYSDNEIIEKGAEESDEEEVSNQIFNVLEAVPPTDYEAPYS